MTLIILASNRGRACSPKTSKFRLRPPMAKDGAAVNRLIADCAPLDTNSVYCNLLQCTHFSQTSVIAEDGSSVGGFVSGYVQPEQPDVLFVWQVAVAHHARGHKLGAAMIDHLLLRPVCDGIHYIETSISPDNAASWALFNSIAQNHNTQLESTPWFSARHHFDGDHDDEHLVRIGPFFLDSRKAPKQWGASE